MRSFAKFAAAIALIAAFFTAPTSAQEKAKKPKKDNEKKKGAALEIPIPEGHEARGLRLPHFENGKLQMFFNIDIAKRIDADRLAMTNVIMETYDDTGAPELSVELPLSVLDLKTRIVKSDNPVTIRRSDFELTGDSMVFNTQTRHGTLTGNVRMLIYNHANLAGEKTE